MSSGSKGNATLIQSAAGHHILVDCGLSVSSLKTRLSAAGRKLEDIRAVLLTHEHSDHSQGVATLSRKLGIPMYLTRGTYHAEHRAGRLKGEERVEIIDCHTGFELFDFQVQPVVVPHDAKEPCQYIFQSGDHRLGLLTDVGKITPHIIEHYTGCDALIVEANHDPEMLRIGPYPPKLKQRVGGIYGHLSNQQTQAFLQAVACERLKTLMIAHISEKNNSEQHVQNALESLDNIQHCDVHIAKQNTVMPWVNLAAKPPEANREVYCG
ncbi:MAG: MBL fold metallo-hydrolase [Pseudomonadota bacterium]|nr:MBL fold metallo-hydrolase [Pseudomonadota bacterium]